MKVVYDGNDDLSFVENDKVALYYDVDIVDFISKNNIKYDKKELLLRKFKDELTYLKFSIDKSPILNKLFKELDFKVIEKQHAGYDDIVTCGSYVMYKDTEIERFSTYDMYVDKCKYHEIGNLKF